jgi:hypothetical protein
MERTGAGAQPGLVFALSNSGEVLRRRVRTCFREKTLLPGVAREGCAADAAGGYHRR